MADLHSIAHELYGLPLGEFIETRDAWATTERDGGDAPLAKDVRALRKPSVTAWAVNLLARSRPELLEELVGLGDQLRQAQASSDGARMRSLDQERRRLMTEIAAEAAAVAEQHDQPLSPAAAVRGGRDHEGSACRPGRGACRARRDVGGRPVGTRTGRGRPERHGGDRAGQVSQEGRALPRHARSGDDGAAEIAAARKAVTAAGREATAAGKAAATARAKLDNAEEQSSDLERQLADLTLRSRSWRND